MAIVTGLLWAVVRADAADKQVRPFIGATFGGGTTFVDLETAVGHPNVVIGATGVVMGDVIGLDVDVGHAPGFFQRGDQHLVLQSSVTTVTGNLIVSLPRRLTEYTLRPYVVGGAGVMHVKINDYFSLQPSVTLATVDVGAGVVGFVTREIGVSWEIRRFQSFKHDPAVAGLNLGEPLRLSFWRAAMAVAIRY